VTRLLGVDLGSRRIGLALADPEVGLARPFATIRRGPTAALDAAALAAVCDAQQVVELIVGLPLEASGVEGEMARLARGWADEIRAILDRPVTLRDERLTSFEAERRLGPMPRSRAGGPPARAARNAHRARIDREAAAIILQDELDARAASRGAR
jgi:putative Holliday junction resolvase